MPILQPGTYAFQNPTNYVHQTYVLGFDGAAEVRTAEGHYLKLIPAAELAALIAALPAWSAVEFTPAPVPTIGKARARKLHVIMSRLGIVNHYKAAGKALSREVTSLAALTIQEAAQVWRYLLRYFPNAQEVAA